MFVPNISFLSETERCWKRRRRRPSITAVSEENEGEGAGFEWTEKPPLTVQSCGLRENRKRRTEQASFESGSANKQSRWNRRAQAWGGKQEMLMGRGSRDFHNVGLLKCVCVCVPCFGGIISIHSFATRRSKNEKGWAKQRQRIKNGSLRYNKRDTIVWSSVKMCSEKSSSSVSLTSLTFFDGHWEGRGCVSEQLELSVRRPDGHVHARPLAQSAFIF